MSENLSSEILTALGEAACIEFDEVLEVKYSKEETDSFIIVMQNGIRYKVIINQIT